MEFVKNPQSFLQSYNKSFINQACSGPYRENIGPRADILPVRPSRLVNKIYINSWCRNQDCSGFTKLNLFKANTLQRRLVRATPTQIGNIKVFSLVDRFYSLSFNLINVRNLPNPIRPNFIMTHLACRGRKSDRINVLRQGLALSGAENVLDIMQIILC